MTFVILMLYALLSVGGLTLFKLGAQRALHIGVVNYALSIQISWLSILGMFMYIMSFLIYLFLVSKMQLSYLMPVTTGIVYALTLFASLFIFHEVLDQMRLIGVILIFIGAILMNIKR